MRTAAALRWISLGLAAAAAACMPIDDIVQGECGNTVIDANEDCDTHDDQGMRCYPAGTEGKGCRYDCSGEKCTGGYACGADGICRAALGTFEPGFAEDEEAELLHVADFDGDGQLDICAVTADRESFVHYLAPDLRSEQTLRLPIGQLTRPATGSLTLADPANSADLALRGGPGRRGVSVLRGRQDRTFAPTVYPSLPIPVAYTVALALDAHVDRDGDEPMSLVTLGTEQTGLGFPLTAMLLVGVDGLLPGGNNLYLLSEVTDATIPPVVDPVTGESAIERVPSGQLDEDLLLSPCDEYVLAFRGDDKVRVATPCIGLVTNGIGGDADFGRIPPEIADLTKPIAIQLPGPVDEAFVVDLDHDGHLDVLATPLASCTPAWAAYGPFHFVPAPDAPPTVVAEPYPLLKLSADEHLLAIADLNGDLEPDFVTSTGISLSQDALLPCPKPPEGAPAGCSPATGQSIRHCPAVEPRAVPAQFFRFGVIGDFDGNAMPDVAACTGEAEELTVFTGQNGGFAEHTIETEGAAHHLTVGDFDGDGRDDIGFAEKPSEAGDISHGVSVCFGSASGAPEPPFGMGRLNNVLSLLAADLRLGNETYVDALAELSIISEPDDPPGTLTFSVLQGSTDRLLSAALILYSANPDPNADPDPAKTFAAMSLAAGQFLLDPDKHGDLAVFSHDLDGAGVRDRRLWLLQSEGDAVLSTEIGWMGPQLKLPEDWDDESGSLSPVDLNGDGIDEVVYLGGRAHGSGGGLLVAQAVAEATWVDAWGAPKKMIPAFLHAPPGSESSFIPTTDAFGAAGGLLAPTPPVIDDLDGDGRPDVAALGISVSDAGLVWHIVVFYNRWTEGLSPLSAITAESQMAFVAPPETRCVVALQLDDDAPLELLAFASSGAYRLDAIGDGNYGTPETVKDLPAGVRAARAVDLDGDGLRDLVLAEPEQVEVQRAVAKRP